MSKKIIFSDFDGTLVGKDLVISERLKKAVHAWEEKGNLFSLATGRLYEGWIERIAKELKLSAPQITMAGAQIIDPLSKKIIFEEVMDDNDVVNLLKVLDKKKLYYWVEKDFTIYNKTGEPRRSSHVVIPHKKISELKIHRIPKIAVKPETDEDEHFLEHDLAKEFSQLHIIKAGSAIGLIFDVTNASVSKHSGVLKVIEHLNLERKHSIGIGDGYNDFPLLTVAGYKVAMGNAVEELKEIADFVTGRYDEDGVAMVIEKLLAKDD